MNEWLKHLKAFYAKNKSKMSYKEAMKEAKKTYKKGKKLKAKEDDMEGGSPIGGAFSLDYKNLKNKLIMGGGMEGGSPIGGAMRHQDMKGGSFISGVSAPIVGSTPHNTLEGGSPIGGNLIGGDGGTYHGRYSSYSGGNIGEETEVIDMGSKRPIEGYNTVNTYQNKSQMRPKNLHITF